MPVNAAFGISEKCTHHAEEIRVDVAAACVDELSQGKGLPKSKGSSLAVSVSLRELQSLLSSQMKHLQTDERSLGGEQPCECLTKRLDSIGRMRYYLEKSTAKR